MNSGTFAPNRYQTIKDTMATPQGSLKIAAALENPVRKLVEQSDFRKAYTAYTALPNSHNKVHLEGTQSLTYYDGGQRILRTTTPTALDVIEVCIKVEVTAENADTLAQVVADKLLLEEEALKSKLVVAANEALGYSTQNVHTPIMFVATELTILPMQDSIEYGKRTCGFIVFEVISMAVLSDKINIVKG